MPVELNDLVLKRLRTITVPIGSDPTDAIAVHWNPTNMTREVYARFEEWRKDETRNDPFDTANYVIVPLVTGWDITVGGEPYPVTVEHVTDLGLDLVGKISRALWDDYNVAADAKKDSAAPS